MASAQGPFAVGTTPLSIAAGDFNGDGKVDLVTTNFGDRKITVLLGASASTSSFLSTTSPASITLGTAVPLTLAVSDTVTAFNAPTGTVTFSDGSTVLGVAIRTASPYAFNATALAVGSHTLTATYSGDTRSLGSNSNSITIQVLLPQTIAFAALPTHIVDDPPFTLNASASSGFQWRLPRTRLAFVRCQERR